MLYPQLLITPSKGQIRSYSLSLFLLVLKWEGGEGKSGDKDKDRVIQKAFAREGMERKKVKWLGRKKEREKNIEGNANLKLKYCIIAQDLG